MRIGRLPVQTLQGAQPGLGTQHFNKDPGDLKVKIVKMLQLTSGEWGCPLNKGPTLAMRQPNSSFKKPHKSSNTLSTVSL